MVTIASLLVKITADTKDADADIRRVDASLGSAAKAGAGFAAGMLVADTAMRTMRAGFTGTIGAAIDFESSFAGVRKTVNASDAELKAISGSIRDMAKEIPTGVNELNRIAESAGQLGVQKGDIVEFTRVVADMGETTNLAGEQAATGMARFANIVQMPMENVDRLASTIVALGNAGASTESEILDLGLRIAGAGHQVGLTEPQILGFANALSSVGIAAEAGGTAISRTFVEIDKAVADGGEKMAGFAAVSGMSAAAFKQAWETDAAGATIAFIEGLGRVEAAGGNVFTVLEDLELGEIRVRDALLRASGAGDLFRESLDLGAVAWQENNALTEEAARRYETAASHLGVLKNNVTDIGIEFGLRFLPAIVAVADYASENLPHAFDWLDETFGPRLTQAGDLLLALAGHAENLAGWLAENEEIAKPLAEAIALATVEMIAFGAAFLAVSVITNPFMLLYASVVALTFAAIYLTENWDELRESVDAIDDVSVGAVAAFEAISGAAENVADWFRENETAAKTLALVLGGALAAGIIAIEAPLLAGIAATRGIQLAFEKWGDSLSGVGAAVWNFTEEVAGAVNEGLGGIPGDLFRLGGEMVAGIWDGISKAWSSFIDWLWDRVQDIPGVIKDFFGISSPSTVMADEVGKPIVEGIAAGMEAGWPSVSGTLDGISVNVLQWATNLRNVVASVFDWSDAVATAQWQAFEEDETGQIRDLKAGKLPVQGERSAPSFSWAGSGGGGGAKEAALSAAEEFAAAWAGEVEHGVLADAFGETGAGLLQQFGEALSNPKGAARLPDIINNLIEEAKEAGVPNAEALGQDLADAIAAGLAMMGPMGSKEVEKVLSDLNWLVKNKGGLLDIVFGSDASIATDAQRKTAELAAAFGAITEAATEAGKLTVDNFRAALSSRAADRRLLEQIGSSGKSLMDALGDAIDKGGAKNLGKLADQVDNLTAKLMDKAPEGQAAYLGTSMMEALTNAINDHGAEAQARLAAVLASVNAIMEGGAIDIRTGTIIAADAIKDLAKAFGTDGKTLVENIQVVVDSGLTGWLGMLDKIPASARTAIAELLNVLERGVFDADNLAKRLAALTPGGGSGSGGSGSGGSGTDSGSGGGSAQVFPGETIAELVERVTGVDVFGGEGSVFEGSRLMGAGDIISAVLSGKFVSDFLYGKYNTGANPSVSGTVTKEGFVPNEPYDGIHKEGIDYVPFDNYVALLHQGERVVPARENRGYGITVGDVHVTVAVQGSIAPSDVQTVTEGFRQAFRKVLEEELTTEALQHGVVN